MTTFSTITVGGVSYNDAQNGTVISSVGENNTSSSFRLTYDNPNGRLSSTFNVGDEVIISLSDILNDVANPVSGYKLDGNSNDEFGGNDGTDTSISYVTGKIGSAADFNGSTSKITVSDAANIQDVFSGGGSVAFWVNPDVAASMNRGIFFKDTLQIWLGSLTSNSYKLNFGAGYTAGSNFYTTDNTVIPENTWTHVVVTFTHSNPSTDTPTIYINGVAVDKTLTNGPASGSINSDAGVDLIIGTRLVSGINLDGQIDNFNYYDFLLTASDVIKLFNIPNKIITGIVEDVKLGGKQTGEKLILGGRDFTARIQDVTVQPVVFTSTEISSIVNSIMNDNVSDITYIPVSTGVTLDRIAFNHTTVYDALKRLAILSNHTFYVDVDKVLQFVPLGATSSGLIFDKTNTLKTKWETSRDDLANQIWVYGDRELSGFSETFTADGAGSVFTLLYKPHSALVNDDGIPKKGAPLNIITTPGSTQQYLVNFHDRKIIFTSGVDTGNNIPVSGNAILVEYDRSLPIVKFGRDRASSDSFGIKEKVIIDKNIKDAQEAEALLKKELDLGSIPILQGTLNVEYNKTITAGQTLVANFPIDGIPNVTYDILEVKYSIKKGLLLSDTGIQLKLNKRIKDANDTITNIAEQLKRVQADALDSSDFLTRFEFVTGSSSQSRNWTVSSRLIQDAFILGHPINGILGSPQTGTSGGQLLLGSDGMLQTFTKLSSGGTF